MTEPDSILHLDDAPAPCDFSMMGEYFEKLYPELRRMAHARLRDNARDCVLDTTALVHESFEKLASVKGLAIENRAHFLAYASRVMRSVVIDIARERMAARRGGGAPQIALTTGLGAQLADPCSDQPEVLRVHDALEELAHIDARLAQIVEMRYFGGLQHAEVAAALGVSKKTVERSWEKARSFLYASLSNK